MIRIEVYRHTGAHAANPKVAGRLARKIRSAVNMGHTVLVDYDRVLSVAQSFAATLLPMIDESKIKVAAFPHDITAMVPGTSKHDSQRGNVVSQTPTKALPKPL